MSFNKTLYSKNLVKTFQVFSFIEIYIKKKKGFIITHKGNLNGLINIVLQINFSYLKEIGFAEKLGTFY